MNVLDEDICSSYQRKFLPGFRWNSKAWTLTCKAGLLEVRCILADRTGTGNACGIRCGTILQLLGKRLLSKNVRDGHPATRLQEAKHLVEDQLLLVLVNKVNHAVGDDDVGDDVIEGDPGDLRLDELNIVGLGLSLVLLCNGEHVLGQRLVSLPTAITVWGFVVCLVHVHPNDSTGLANFLRGEEDVETGTRPEINDGFSLERLSAADARAESFQVN